MCQDSPEGSDVSTAKEKLAEIFKQQEMEATDSMLKKMTANSRLKVDDADEDLLQALKEHVRGTLMTEGHSGDDIDRAMGDCRTLKNLAARNKGRPLEEVLQLKGASMTIQFEIESVSKSLQKAPEARLRLKQARAAPSLNELAKGNGAIVAVVMDEVKTGSGTDLLWTGGAASCVAVAIRNNDAFCLGHLTSNQINTHDLDGTVDLLNSNVPLGGADIWMSSKVASSDDYKNLRSRLKDTGAILRQEFDSGLLAISKTEVFSLFKPPG